MLNHTSIEACFEHFDLLTVKDLNCVHTTQSRAEQLFRRMIRAHRRAAYSKLGQVHRIISSTTSLLTATTLVYAIGAGITAAAGTRLALQWILVKDFRLYSFRLPDS